MSTLKKRHTSAWAGRLRRSEHAGPLLFASVPLAFLLLLFLVPVA